MDRIVYLCIRLQLFYDGQWCGDYRKYYLNRKSFYDWKLLYNHSYIYAFLLCNKGIIEEMSHLIGGHRRLWTFATEEQPMRCL